MWYLSQFPSLTGVIRFLIIVYIDNKLRTEKFPSLTGVIRFLIIIGNADNVDLLCEYGFRPLQGLFVF